MDGSILKITGLTPQLEMEIADLLEEAALVSRCAGGGDLFATFDEDGKVVGLACAERRAENCLIHFVVVRPVSRMNGAGSALVNHVLGYFAGRCDRAYVASGGAEGFFERFGFVPVRPGETPAVVTEAGLTVGPGAEAAGDEGASGIMVLELPSIWTIP
ncbi:MAG TPA: GNAT family N-acetyltransferase [Patescibacteria group bacterium]|nr:GNAT family N-acetyltransferase [Patescibacteria group bacterium]